MNFMLPPAPERFTLREKTIIENLHRRLGDDWNAIAKKLPNHSATAIKVFWIKKVRSENILRAFLMRKDLLTPLNPDPLPPPPKSVPRLMIKIAAFPSKSELSKPSALDILASVASEELERERKNS